MLKDQKCVPCEGGMPPLTHEEATTLLKQIEGWTLAPDAKTISKELKFKNFAQALARVDAIGAIAESEGHHPDLTLAWGRVGISLTTHAIGGLSVNDFIIAAKIDAL